MEVRSLTECDTTSDHIYAIERHICVIKEKSRSCRHTLPFKHTPKAILVVMLTNCELCLNSFTLKGGVSKSVSNHTISTGVKFDYNKHC